MSLEDEVQQLKNELRQFKQDFGSHLRTTLSSAEAMKEQLEMIDMLTARVQASDTINWGVVAALRNNDAFLAGVAFAAGHRIANFNGSTRTDEQIEAFKTSLKNLLPMDLRHLAD